MQEQEKNFASTEIRQLTQKEYNELCEKLNLEPNISHSISTISQTFRKLSLKYHPDRLVGKSEEEKTAAAEKFKEINNASADLIAHTQLYGQDNFRDSKKNNLSDSKMNIASLNSLTKP